MMNNERFNNDVDKQDARMMANRHQNLSIEERQSINSYFNTFHMYCENNVIERFRRLQEKLASKNLMFKFDGSKYAIFPMDQFDRETITGYKLTLEEAEDFAEKYKRHVSDGEYHFIKQQKDMYSREKEKINNDRKS